MNVDSFAFDGGMVTAKQLARQVTAYKEGALQSALEAGCQSVPAVMAYLARRDAEQAAYHKARSRAGKAITDARIKRARGQAVAW